jgi:hypothetical protein
MRLFNYFSVGIALSSASFFGPAHAQDVASFEYTMATRGVWELLYTMPSRPFVTDGYDVLFDRRTITKISEGEWEVDLALGNHFTGRLWDTKIRTATYRVNCSANTFTDVGWRIDGHLTSNPKAKMRKIGRHARPLYDTVCLRGDAIIAELNEGARRAKEAQAALEANSAVVVSKALETGPSSFTSKGGNKTVGQKSKTVPDSSESGKRTYYANGVTVSCVTENGKSVCK